RAARAAAREPAASTAVDDWRSFGWLTGVVILRSVLYFGISSLPALFVIDRFDVDQVIGSAALVTFLAVGAVGTLIGGWLADRYGRLPAIRLGYPLALPALVLLLVAPGWPLAIAAAALLALGVHLPFSVQTTLGQEYLPNRIGTASVVTIGLAVSAGGAVAPLLGLLADPYGLPWALGSLLALPPLALVLTFRLKTIA
ncbi:MFS transporter, partial [Blastococcus sp. BMG 814]|nr:MFS transporter [Blastococcus carthaginiensis]